MLFLTVFLFDLFLLILCITLVKKQGTWTFLHPATIYFGFHIFVVTLRVFAILNGAPTLFNEPLYANLGFSPITQDEIIRATLFADLALFASTLAFMKAYEDDKRRQQQNVSVKRVSTEIVLQKNRVYPVLLLTGVVGIIGFVVISYLPGSSTRLVDSFELGEWGSSSWIFITQFWLASVLIGLIYMRGFNRLLLLLFVIYLILQLFQGFHRFRLVLPVVMLINIYVLRNGLRWPPKWIVILGLIGMLLFFRHAKCQSSKFNRLQGSNFR